MLIDLLVYSVGKKLAQKSIFVQDICEFFKSACYSFIEWCIYNYRPFSSCEIFFHEYEATLRVF